MFKLAGITPAALALAALTLSAAAHADVDLKLGSTERVTRLFAYPNNCSVICYRNWSLEQTVAHYLSQSVQRDGYANAKVLVKNDNGQIYVEISGVPQGYDKPLSALLDAGDLAYNGASKLNATQNASVNGLKGSDGSPVAGSQAMKGERPTPPAIHTSKSPVGLRWKRPKGAYTSACMPGAASATSLLV